MRAALPILTLALLAQTATADLVRVSSERVLRVRGFDGTGAEAFKTEQVRTDTGDWTQSLDGFGFVGPNFLAGSTYQRSNMDAVLTPQVPNSLMLLQGSAALAGNISTADPLIAWATSSASYTFSTDVAAKIRIIWSLESTGLANPWSLDSPSGFTLTRESDIFAGPILQQDAGVGEINTGFITLTIDPGTYTLKAGAYASLYQGDRPVSTLPGSPEQAGGYTVTMALLPSPASVLPLAMAGLLASRRRR
ncbi:MAG: hypothetical protein ACI89L_001712 [Phycisphaerales bacterium]